MIKQKYEIRYDYYGKAYLEVGKFQFHNRKSSVPHCIMYIKYMGTTYNYVTINNMHLYTDSDIFKDIVYFYCYAKGVS